MTTPIEICLGSFIHNFLVDISPDNFGIIQLKLLTFVLPALEGALPANSLDSIATDLYNCLQPTIGSAAITTSEQIGLTLLFLIVLTAIFLILLVVILGLLDKTNQPEVAIGLVLLLAIMYVAVGSIIIYNTSLNMTNDIAITSASIDTCFSNFATELTIFEAANVAAVNTGLCAYPTIL